MKNRGQLRGVCFAFTIGVLLLLVPLQESIHSTRPQLFDPERKTRRKSAIAMGPTPAVIAALGGFRTVAADLLWLKAHRVWHGGSWWALMPILESVTELDPHFIMAWKVYGWHAAYNLHAESETVIDRRHWLSKGIEVLERAVEANPDTWDMWFELGWTLYDRAHQKERAAEYFYKADQFPDAPHYITRLYYRCYEDILDMEKLLPALEYARERHKDVHLHQFLVNRDYEFWQTHKDDPFTHRRIIVSENSERQQRSVPFYLYPDNPYWDVCPRCGLPSPEGSETCEVCGAELPDPSQVSDSAR